MKTISQRITELLPPKFTTEEVEMVENVRRKREGFNEAINATHKIISKLVREGKITLS